jgi:hypothetical protein
MCQSRAGRKTPRTFGGAPSARGFPLSAMTQNPNIQSACWQPLANGQRPLTRQPPAAGSAVPMGGTDPAMITSGPSW